MKSFDWIGFIYCITIKCDYYIELRWSSNSKMISCEEDEDTVTKDEKYKMMVADASHSNTTIAAEELSFYESLLLQRQEETAHRIQSLWKVNVLIQLGER